MNEVHNFISNCIKADAKLKIMLDLEGCDTTYKVLDCDIALNSDESFAKELEDYSLKGIGEINEMSEFPSLLDDSRAVDDLTERVYILPENQSLNYDQLIQKLELKDLTNAEGSLYIKSGNNIELENIIAEAIEEEPINDELQAEAMDEVIPPVDFDLDKLDCNNLIKEVDFSGNSSIKHDYSNMLKHNITSDAFFSEVSFCYSFVSCDCLDFINLTFSEYSERSKHCSDQQIQERYELFM